MLSAQTLHDINTTIAVKAAQKGLTPYVPWNLEEVQEHGVDFLRFIPNIGYLELPDWDLVESHLCDKSGLGREDEPALTVGQTLELIEEWTAKGSYGYAIIEEGQFQVVLGIFEKAPVLPDQDKA